MYVWVYIYAIGMYTSRYVYRQTYISLFVYAYISVCNYAYMYVGRHVYMYVFACIHILHTSMDTCPFI